MINAIRLSRLYAQGARCGHAEAYSIALAYDLHQAYVMSCQASRAFGFYSEDEREMWAKGYRHGYRLAARGSVLDMMYVQAGLP